VNRDQPVREAVATAVVDAQERIAQRIADGTPRALTLRDLIIRLGLGFFALERYATPSLPACAGVSNAEAAPTVLDVAAAVAACGKFATQFASAHTAMLDVLRENDVTAAQVMLAPDP
jgi:LDH2 family malate/lactate/ureidoglycolate dehydrogenase